MRRKLPIGIQTFATIREDGHYYVDKTPFALQLLEQGRYFFLSRPRRFGKSLFLDTLKELFEGNQGLFEGLFIYDRWDWAVRHPIVRLSLGGGVVRDRADLDARLREWLDATCRMHDHQLEAETLAGGFAELLRALHLRTNRQVVVLVDEYDKPILDHLTDPARAGEMRDGLRDLYSVIKDSDAHVRFAFLTGVSKFSKVSLFSGLNNLQDITLDAKYSAICGYTDADVDAVFAPELEGLDRDKIRHWYNGYNWTGEAVYNPFDLLLLFQNRQFRSYWFETGTPTFLVKLLAERHTWVPELDGYLTDADLLSAFDVDQIGTDALMFQTGYLTIRETQDVGGRDQYRLRYPNREVYQSLNNSLLGVLVADRHALVKHRTRLHELLQAGEYDATRELFQAFFASIPHDWYRKNQLAGYEGYYASIFYSYFAALGLDVVVEDATNHGRIDMAVRLDRRVLLFEFKVVEHAPEGRALAQLQAKRYAEKYRAAGVAIVLIGVEFSRESRNITGFEVQVDAGAEAGMAP